MNDPISHQAQDDVIHVVVATMPEVRLQLVIEEIRQQPHIVVSAVARTNVDLLKIVTPTTDVVILGANALTPAPGIVSHLLSEFPLVRVLVVSNVDDSKGAYWLGLRFSPLAAEKVVGLTNCVRWLYDLDEMTPGQD